MYGRALRRVRGPVDPSYDEGTNGQPCINTRGECLSAFGLPQCTQTVLCGESYQVRTTTLTAPVTAIPTTACLLGLWNGEPDNGKCYIIEAVFGIYIASGLNNQEISLLTNVSLQPIPTAIANTLTPRPLACNRVGYGGRARVAVGITLAAAAGGVASNWFPVGKNSSLISGATQKSGGVNIAYVGGRYIIPPKGQFSLSAIAPIATGTSVSVGVRWHEAILPPMV